MKVKKQVRFLLEQIKVLESRITTVQKLKPILTHKDVMKLEDISYSTFKRRYDQGKIPAKKEGKNYVMTRDAYLAYINS